MSRRRVLILLASSGILASSFSLYPQLRRTFAPERPPAQFQAQQATTFLIVFGVGDRQPEVWDGTVSVTGGQVLNIQGWRFAQRDSTDGRTRWRLATRHGANDGPLMENGVLLTISLQDPAARISIETAQGGFSFSAQEVAYWPPRPFLNGRALALLAPQTWQLTNSIEEEDFPAIAERGNDVWVSYVRFVHGDRSQRMQGQLQQEPANFDALARPAGGDQVLLLHYSKATRVWTGPFEVTAPGQDIFRTAVAIDGRSRVWVFWSANYNGNFDLYARFLDQGKWSARLRLTTDPGPDLNPVAVTDARGSVWVAWQGFRDNNLEILAALQQGDDFSEEHVVSASRFSDWDPAIAASSSGDVTVSWDTYDKGDYDVYFRRMRAVGNTVRADDPTPAAASPNFEARSTIVFDQQDRLWIAYEASDVKWGKDFGAYEKSGVALYQGHTLRVKCFGQDPRRSVWETAARLSDVLPGQANLLFAKRLGAASGALNSFPRLAVDSDGKVYLAFRSMAGTGRSSVGSVWIENLVYFDGARWHGPVIVPHTDALLDSRPALLALGPGHLLMVSAMDHRQSPPSAGVNYDLYAAEFRAPQGRQGLQLVRAPAEVVQAPSVETQMELNQVAEMRNWRPQVAGQQYRLMRGEFHRHTEISGDGGRDGPLVDAYRYLIDSASMDWGGTGDHDYGGNREYNWWLEQKMADAYKLGDRFVPMFTYERSVRYPEGHRNVVFARRGIRPLPRLPKMADDSPPAPAPDTQMLYRYLKQFNGVCASHTSATDMGTDWRDNDPIVEPVVEIYQGDRQNYEMPGAPRSNSESYSIGGWRPLGFVSQALLKGYRLGFQSSSDHISTHMSYCNLWVKEPTREGIMEAFAKRRVYGATDNILADVRCGEHFMGEEFTVTEPPEICVKMLGAWYFSRIHIIKDGQYVYTLQTNDRWVDFAWRDNAAERGKTSYYYVRGEQADGELVWVSPMWITYR